MYLIRQCLPIALALSILAGCASNSTLSTQETRLTSLTQELSRHGDTASAVTLYERAAASMPDNPDIVLALGKAHLRNGNPRAAAEAFRQVYRMRSGDPDAVLGLGYASLLEGDVERAYALVAEAAPKLNTYMAYNLLGITATLNGDFSGAHAAFGSAQTLAPENLEIKSNQALAYALNNDMPDAIQQITAVTASPLAESHHVRRQALILVLASQDEQAKKLLRTMPKNEQASLLGQARRIREISDPAERAAAIGIIPTFSPAKRNST